MIAAIKPSLLSGRIKAIASKSQAHRMLICAAFADGPTQIVCPERSDDIDATAECLRGLGATIKYDADNGSFSVEPIHAASGKTSMDPSKCGHTSCDTGPEAAVGQPVAAMHPTDCSESADISDGGVASEAADDDPVAAIDCGESGSTLRFLLPVICALGTKARITMHGRLPERPLSPLWEELIRHGCSLVKNEDKTITVSGPIEEGDFEIAADVSSQFISGLLFAMPLVEKPYSIRLEGHVESADYINMTMNAMRLFGVDTVMEDGCIRATYDRPRYISPGITEVEGDWSNGAFWLCAARISEIMQESTHEPRSFSGLEVYGLDPDSPQGDKAVKELIELISGGNATVDAKNVPDLVPVLSVLASVVPGTTTFINAGRLRIKESDRIKTTVELLTHLGAKAEETEDGLKVTGNGILKGGRVNSAGDHRIAMSAAVASIACAGDVIIEGAEAVRKSYPRFWEDFGSIGGVFTLAES